MRRAVTKRNQGCVGEQWWRVRGLLYMEMVWSVVGGGLLETMIKAKTLEVQSISVKGRGDRRTEA